jgi:hypothetical protein
MLSSFENKIELSLEQLLEDERLRSNLLDAEAKLLFDWATARLTGSVSALEDEAAALEALRTETRRVRQTLRTINDLLDDDRLPTPPESLAALNLPTTAGPDLLLPDRLTFIQWLLPQVSAAWIDSPAEI